MHYRTHEELEDVEESDEESDDGDVFAFLPPTTPEPTFDPNARFSDTQRFQSFAHPPPPPTPLHAQPQSPPSTDSHSAPDPYQLKRLSRSQNSSAQVRVSLKQSSAGTSFAPDPDDYDDESREGSIKMEFDFDAIEEEDSPFPEVRASVSNMDDPDMPAMTIRMWFVGLISCLISSSVNVFFNFRSPAPSVVPLALLLMSYPMGKLLAYTLPITTYRIRLPGIPRFLVPSLPPPSPLAPSNASFFARILSWIQRKFATIRTVLHVTLQPLSTPAPIEFSLNPGPWSIKEHVLVFIMANVAVAYPYALNAIVVAEVYYKIKLGYWFALVLVLATQLTGFGLAGLCRRFLVWPASMVWPQNLVACALLNTLHAEEESADYSSDLDPKYPPKKPMRGISRYRFFMYLSLAAFFWFFLPGFLFQALSVFSFVCWLAPNNVPLNQMFGVYSGLGMSVITFDWTQISWIGSPLMFPWWAQVHIFFGFVLFYWILTPILYYTNSWNLSYFPISANVPYDKFGNLYDIGRVLKQDDTFDVGAYIAYSPLYLPATYAVCYLIAFAMSTCVITHTLLYHGKSLLNGMKKIRVEPDDIHAKLMRNYPEVPDWWYLTAFVIFFSLAIVAVEIWHTEVPVWALLLSVLLPIIYVLPSGFIYAMTGQGITLNIIAQVVPGALLPGKPLANMIFKAYSVQTLSEATSFVQDLKLGHYVKVPPRATFLVQLVSTTLVAFVQVGVKTWIFSNVPDICDSKQKSQLTCPHNQVFYTASAVWGLVGPSRQFGPGSVYHPHLYAMIVGIFLPLPFYFWQRRYPTSWVKNVSTPVILNGVAWIPPATGINYSSWFAVGFVFQYLIRKRNFAWWAKFNYVTSAALDSGTVFAVMFIFFTLQFPKHGSIQVNWWGNSVFQNTADYHRKPLFSTPDGGIPG